jgi:hypothetical protein
MRNLGKGRYSAVEVLTDEHAVEPLVCLGENQDFFTPRDVLEFHDCLPGATP